VSRPRRLPAEERRRAIVQAALRVFASGSYAGSTTAEIAREAGVSEPVLYRHFGSKRELWAACLDAAWEELRDALDTLVDTTLALPRHEVVARGATPLPPAGARWKKALLPNLWMQGITEAADDREIRRHVARHMRAVHDHAAARLRDAQAAGIVPADRDPDAEAWVIIAGGLLRSVADRLGGLLDDDDLEAIKRERLRWILGDAVRE
jgi:AcrR family transcriptional regulator